MGSLSIANDCVISAWRRSRNVANLIKFFNFRASVVSPWHVTHILYFAPISFLDCTFSACACRQNVEKVSVRSLPRIDSEHTSVARPLLHSAILPRSLNSWLIIRSVHSRCHAVYDAMSRHLRKFLQQATCESALQVPYHLICVIGTGACGVAWDAFEFTHLV